MPSDRYFLPEKFSKNLTLELFGNEFHHLSKVMRHTEGSFLEIINGQGELARAKILSFSKNSALLSIEEIFSSPEKKNKIILAQALPKKPHLDWILEKGTELGADTFWLFPSKLSEKNFLSPSYSTRIESLLIASIKQCGRLDLPTWEFFPDWKKFSQKLPALVFFGDTRPEAPGLLKEFVSISKQETTCIFVGPEKGFTKEEVFYLEKTLQAKGVKIHENILRVETASIAFLACISLLLQGKPS